MSQLVDVAFGYDGFADLFTNVEFSLEMGSRICLCGTGWARCGTRARQCSAVQCSSECGRSVAGFPLGSLCRAGPNGIGKSTLLNVIKGLMPPRFGMVTINPKLRLGSFAQVRVSLTARVSIPCGTVSHTAWSLRRHARDEPTCRTCSFYMLFRMLNVVPLR
jgi:hypothetical protein